MQVALTALTLIACDDGDPAGPNGDGIALPSIMDLNGTAEIERDDGMAAACWIFLHVVLDETIDSTAEAIVYSGTAGGEANRTVFEGDSTGLSFWPLLHSNATVRATADSIEIMAEGHDTVSSRFYAGIMHFRGARAGPGEAHGTWTCAPLDLDSDGWLDTSVVAPGTWTLEEFEE